MRKILCKEIITFQIRYSISEKDTGLAEQTLCLENAGLVEEREGLQQKEGFDGKKEGLAVWKRSCLQKGWVGSKKEWLVAERKGW